MKNALVWGRPKNERSELIRHDATQCLCSVHRVLGAKNPSSDHVKLWWMVHVSCPALQLPCSVTIRVGVKVLQKFHAKAQDRWIHMFSDVLCTVMVLVLVSSLQLYRALD